MPTPLRQLHHEHHDIIQLLKPLEQGRQACSPDRALLRDIMHYLTHYTDLFHHPREELIFNRVAEYDPPLRELIADLSHEHQRLAGWGTQLYRSLNRSVDDDVLSQLNDYARLLRRHMAREEQQVFALAAELLNNGDWAYVESAMRERADPQFGALVDKQYRLRHENILRML